MLSARAGIRRTLADLRAVGRHAVVLGVINGALPFWLIAWGEKYVDSGVAAIANATVPIFVALLAIRIRPSERASGSRLVGILVGLAGVAVLAGVDPQGGWWAVAGTLAIVLSSLAYARANLYTQDNLPTTPAPVIVCAVGLAGGLLILPAGIAQAPASVPGLDALGAVVALSVLGTVIASIAHYTMLQRYGSARTSLVAYLIPVTALAYGAGILDEPLTLNALLWPRPHPARSCARLRDGADVASRRARRRGDLIVLELGDGFRLRPAVDDDVAALAALAARPEIAGSLASVSPGRKTTFAARSPPVVTTRQAEGRYVLEVEENGSWKQPAGSLSRARTAAAASPTSSASWSTRRSAAAPWASVPSACSPCT